MGSVGSYTRASGAGYTSGEEGRQLTKAVIASTIGTTIEWYDVLLYGLLVPLYLGRLFFPSRDAVASSLAGSAVLLISFAMRPVGAMIFGRIGDRRGRKAALVVTLVAAGLSTAAFGLLPTYQDAQGLFGYGIVAPMLLCVLRFAVGLSIGGEWGGAVLLALEWAGRGRRGFAASWAQMGVPAATLLGFLAIRGSSALFGPTSTWAWRAPFLASIILVAVGLYVRLGVLETPPFSRLLESRRTEQAPVMAALRLQWREVVLAASLRLAEQAPLVVFTTVFLVYGSAVLGLQQGLLVSVSIAASVVGIGATLFFGYLSDVVGRRSLYLTGVVLMFAFALPYWFLLNTRSLSLILLAAVAGQVIVGMMAGANAAFIAEAFTGRVRYSGASLGAGLGAFFAGGLATVFPLALLQQYHSAIPIGFYLMVLCVISYLGGVVLRERSHQDLAVEYDEPGLAAGEGARA